MFCARYSVLPALSLDGMLFLKVVEGSFDGQLFLAFITDLLDFMEPFPSNNSVLVMDNCAIHKSDAIREVIESRYVGSHYL